MSWFCFSVCAYRCSCWAFSPFVIAMCINTRTLTLFTTVKVGKWFWPWASLLFDDCLIFTFCHFINFHRILFFSFLLFTLVAMVFSWCIILLDLVWQECEGVCCDWLIVEKCFRRYKSNKNACKILNDFRFHHGFYSILFRCISIRWCLSLWLWLLLLPFTNSNLLLTFSNVKTDLHEFRTEASARQRASIIMIILMGISDFFLHADHVRSRGQWHGECIASLY